MRLCLLSNLKYFISNPDISQVQQWPQYWPAAAQHQCWWSGSQSDRGWHRHIRGARLEPHEGPAGHGQSAQDWSEEGGQCVQVTTSCSAWLQYSRGSLAAGWSRGTLWRRRSCLCSSSRSTPPGVWSVMITPAYPAWTLTRWSLKFFLSKYLKIKASCMFLTLTCTGWHQRTFH